MNIYLCFIGLGILTGFFLSTKLEVTIILFIFGSIIFFVDKEGLIHLKRMYRDISNFIVANLREYYAVFDREKFTCQRFDCNLLISEIQGVASAHSGKAIYLKTRKRDYCLANRLTPSESNWLVNEIKDWLADC
jgi:hypothetical protein